MGGLKGKPRVVRGVRTEKGSDGRGGVVEREITVLEGKKGKGTDVVIQRNLVLGPTNKEMMKRINGKT